MTLLQASPARPVRPSHARRGDASSPANPPAARLGPQPAVGVACLAGRLGPDVLLAAQAEAARAGVRPEDVLLSEGRISEESYYRALARWLGLRFVDAPFAASPHAAYPDALHAGLVPTVDEPPLWIMAPRGARLAALAGARGRGVERFAIATPTVLRASVMAAQAGEIAAAAACSLNGREGEATAQGAPCGWQAACFAALVALALCALAFGDLAGVLAALLFTAVFAAGVGLRLLAAAATLSPRAPAPPLPDHDLPTYTILIALYREAAVVGRLVAGLEALDYPRAKLDVKLVIEADDAETAAALAALTLPPRYEVLTAPPGAPRTKPRALNIGLALARGECIVIFDAEDEPEPDQLRKAAAAFAAAPGSVACLQARLTIDNIDDGLLPKFFALEYAALFEVLNPGLSALRAPIALGGTSNHFRTQALRAVGGWDAWNVTEDIDLGFRLARHGYDVETLDSVTHEEAPAGLGAWINQRRRWFKGWMQTLVAHTRSPGRLAREMGWARVCAASALLLGALLGPMAGPIFAVATIDHALRGDLLTPADGFAVAASAVWCGVWLGGGASAAWPLALGMARQRLWSLAWLVPLVPFYWLLQSLAAWWALVDFFRQPFYWAKTQHGLARSSRRRARIAPAP